MSDVKIGILTFVKVGNYGAELQSFALQNFLDNQGYDAETINFSIKKANKVGYRSLYNTRGLKIKVKSTLFAIFSTIIKFLNKSKYKKRNASFEDFYNQYLKLSNKEIMAFKDMYTTEFNYSHVIVGSDQVWNYTFDFSVAPFLLDFLPLGVKKISYAASFGVNNLPNSLEKLYKDCLSEFSSISVREESGAKIVKSILSNSVKVVVDPTLLLSKAQWAEKLNLVTTTKESYILVYMLTYSSVLLKFMDKLSKHTGLKVIQIEPNFFSYSFSGNSVEHVFDAGPRDFVELFYNASYILTTSFHGTAFAVNFRKPFYTFLSSERKSNSRMKDFLISIGLEDRIIYNIEECDLFKFINIDYSDSEKHLEFIINDSMNFLNLSV